MYGGAVVSAVASQWEGPGFNPQLNCIGLGIFFCALPVLEWITQKHIL